LDTDRFSQQITLTPENNKGLLNLCGLCDEHLQMLERSLKIIIKQRGYDFLLSGNKLSVQQGEQALIGLYEIAQHKKLLTPHQVHLFLHNILSTAPEKTNAHRVSNMEIRTKRCVINARGDNQKIYLKNIADFDISFGIGPAGTGKTFLTVATAVQALEAGRVSKIILVRPIVEAGEKLGFLPGDLAQKVHPYVQPLYDALHEMIGFEEVAQLMENGIIELVPLAYMRGRSLNDAFIILDEGQNTTKEQMKMFLTRLGFNSKAVITGDVTQIDLPNPKESGLIHAVDVLKNVTDISFTHFLSSDVVRHPLVQTIVEAYEHYTQPSAGLKK
jgi:phosphate starvation-inducible PhoH-like protein